MPVVLLCNRLRNIFENPPGYTVVEWQKPRTERSIRCLQASVNSSENLAMPGPWKSQEARFPVEPGGQVGLGGTGFLPQGEHGSRPTAALPQSGAERSSGCLSDLLWEDADATSGSRHATMDVYKSNGLPQFV